MSFATDGRGSIAAVVISVGTGTIALASVLVLGVLLPDATDPAAYGSAASIAWAVSAGVMLAAWVTLLLALSRVWGARPGEAAWAKLTCGLLAYSVPATALGLYLFGTGIAISERPPALDLTSLLLGLSGPAAFIGGCAVGLARFSGLLRRA
ncbi:MAG: hypothetical protein LH624_12260 [Cryobacterium sp.]|nr:hypothetical protein [Cryobacterium sp.]